MRDLTEIELDVVSGGQAVQQTTSFGITLSATSSPTPIGIEVIAIGPGLSARGSAFMGPGQAFATVSVSDQLGATALSQN